MLMTGHSSEPVTLAKPPVSARLPLPGRLLTPAASFADIENEEAATVNDFMQVEEKGEAPKAGELEAQQEDATSVKKEEEDPLPTTAAAFHLPPSPPESPKKYLRAARGRRSTGPEASAEAEDGQNRQKTPDGVAGPLALLELNDRLGKGKKRAKE